MPKEIFSLDESFLFFLAFSTKALWWGEYSTDWGLGFSRGGGRSGCGFDANLEQEEITRMILRMKRTEMIFVTSITSTASAKLFPPG